MRKINETNQREAKAGGFRCIMCGATDKTVGSTFAKQYWHCIKHSARLVISVAEFIRLCTG